MKTPTFLFEQEFRAVTTKRRRDQRGRMFASHTILHVKVMNSNEIRLLYIETLQARRRRGFATDALVWLCELADAYELNISLTPVNVEDDNMTVAQLTTWYRTFGFVNINSNDNMLRYSHATRS